VSDAPDETPGYAMCAAMSDLELATIEQPRHVLVTRRPWMDAYCSFWLWGLALYRAAMNQHYTLTNDGFKDGIIGPQYRSEEYRLNLLGLAGGSIKLAMDAALAGYYNSCMALERHMLETWSRSVYTRLHPEDIWRFFPVKVWPKGNSPMADKDDFGPGKMPTWPPTASTIAKVIK
jgi:hypothetical protein